MVASEHRAKDCHKCYIAAQDEVRQLQSLLDRSRSQQDSLTRQVGDQASELTSLRCTVVSTSRQLASSEQEMDRVKAELRVQSAAFQDMQAEREVAQLEVCRRLSTACVALVLE